MTILKTVSHPAIEEFEKTYGLDGRYLTALDRLALGKHYLDTSITKLLSVTEFLKEEGNSGDPSSTNLMDMSNEQLLQFGVCLLQSAIDYPEQTPR